MADGEGAERGKKYYDHLCKYLEGCEDATELSKTNVEKCKNKIVNTESACETTIRKVDIWIFVKKLIYVQEWRQWHLVVDKHCMLLY